MCVCMFIHSCKRAAAGPDSKDKCFTVTRSDSEEGSYGRLIDLCITQL